MEFTEVERGRRLELVAMNKSALTYLREPRVRGDHGCSSATHYLGVLHGTMMSELSSWAQRRRCGGEQSKTHRSMRIVQAFWITPLIESQDLEKWRIVEGDTTTMYAVAESGSSR